MTSDEFDVFSAKFCIACGVQPNDAAFMDFWKSEALKRDLDAMEFAIEQMVSDQRIADKSHPAAYARNRLPILCEYADQYRARKADEEQWKDLRKMREKGAPAK